MRLIFSEKINKAEIVLYSAVRVVHNGFIETHNGADIMNTSKTLHFDFVGNVVIALVYNDKGYRVAVDNVPGVYYSDVAAAWDAYDTQVWDTAGEQNGKV